MEQQISATTAWIYSVLFAYLPYVAFGIFIAGLIWRIRHANPTIQALSTQFLSNDKMIKWGSPLFHFAVIGVFFGHIFGLLAPEPLYIWLMSNETKRLLAIIMGGAAGIIALIGITLMMVRRFCGASTPTPPAVRLPVLRRWDARANMARSRSLS